MLDILQYEVGRHAQWAADLARRHKAADTADTEAVSALAAKFSSFVAKQEQTLRVSIYLLLNLSEDIKVSAALEGAFNQEKALVGAFSVIVQLHRSIDLRH